MLAIDSRDGMRALVFGDETAVGLGGTLSDRARTLMFGLLAAAGPLMIITWADPRILGNPGGILRFELVCLAVMMALRFVHDMLADGTPAAAVFDPSRSALTITTRGPVGASSTTIDFDDIADIRMARGEWSAESVAEVPVVHLRSRRTVALPAGMSRSDLTVVKLLTGLH